MGKFKPGLEITAENAKTNETRGSNQPGPDVHGYQMIPEVSKSFGMLWQNENIGLRGSNHSGLDLTMDGCVLLGAKQEYGITEKGFNTFGLKPVGLHFKLVDSLFGKL